MQHKLVINIGQLINVREKTSLPRGKELAELNVLENAFIYIDEGLISGYGPMDGVQDFMKTGAEIIDAKGASVLPCWCDSHTHTVFAASREDEFVDKIKGLSYAEIAAKGGGILNSAKKLNAMDEDELYGKSFSRLYELIRLGTGAIEIKSGYGLCLEGELKMLRVIKRLRETAPIPVKATFLGAHAYPLEYKNDHAGYLRLITDKMLPAVAEEGLADYIDVFCENGFFSVEETATVCRAGKQFGLKPKVHVNQLNSIGGITTGIRLNAVSMDHLEVMTDADIAALANSNTIGTLLPSAAFFLGMPYQPARAIIDAGCAVALASDYNPGSSPSGNMGFVVSLACTQMKMLPGEAINAATLGGAYAMELGHELGSITVGKKANLIFTKPIPSVAYIPYSFGTNLVDKVMIGGQWV
jgi:imidazolonepropionase